MNTGRIGRVVPEVQSHSDLDIAIQQDEGDVWCVFFDDKLVRVHKTGQAALEYIRCWQSHSTTVKGSFSVRVCRLFG